MAQFIPESNFVNVTIQHATDVPDGEIPQRRTLGVLEFVPKDGERIPSFYLPETPVIVDADGSLVLHSAFAPSNRALSVMVGYHTSKGVTHVFTGVTTWRAAPYFAFRLPTGQFIEFYFGPTLAELDESIYDVLGAIRKRPGMYIVEPSIYRLQSFLVGFDVGLGRVGFGLRDGKDFHRFHDWVARRLGYSGSTSGWANMIREKCRSDEDAFAQFYVLLDEFRKEPA